jgi:RNA polymerase sigma factor (sigma-70 family)
MSALRRHRLIRWESLDTPGVGSLEVLSSPVAFEDQLVERAVLQAALAQLPTKDVTCLVLHVVQGFTAAETAQIMGDSPQAIAKRITRAKQRLLTAYVVQDAGHTGSKRL